MAIGKKLVQAIHKESVMRMPLPHSAEATQDLPRGKTVRASAVIADQDRYTQVAREIRVSVEGDRPTPARQGSPSEQKARQFAARVTYLPERLQFVECEPDGTSIVRSTPETMAGKGAPYFEATVNDSAITLRRHTPGTAQEARRQTEYCLTEDLVERVVEDAAAALGCKAVGN